MDDEIYFHSDGIISTNVMFLNDYAIVLQMIMIPSALI